MENSELFEKLGTLEFEAGEAGHVEAHKMWTDMAAALMKESLGQLLPLSKKEAAVPMLTGSPEQFYEIIKKQVSAMPRSKQKETLDAIRQIINQYQTNGALNVAMADALRAKTNQIEDELNAD